MKSIKIFLVAIISLLLFNITNATYRSSSNWYNPPIMDGSISFKAKLKDWKVYTSWTKYNKNEWFKYYKVIRSQTVLNPVYPDNGYIKYSRDINFTSYVDEKVPSWINYYRVCAITTEKNRYCSNVVKIINNSKNEIYKVWPKKVDCYGSHPQKCLIVNWKYFYDDIKGFDYKEWYEYKIEVKKEKACNSSIVWNCPQDTGIYKYSLVKIISKQKVGKPKICTMEYAPVCGEKYWKQKTYSNKCMLDAAWAKFLYKWECKKRITPCPLNFPNPIALCWKNWKVIVLEKDKNWCAIKYWCEKKNIIPKNCIYWYDWCNNCTVKNWKIISCTKRYCIRHDTPKCLKYKEEQINLNKELKEKIDRILEKFIKKIENKYKTNEKKTEVLKKVINNLERLKNKKPKAINIIEYINYKLKEKIKEYNSSINEIEQILNQY